MRTVVGRVDRCDRGDLVGVAVICEPSGFEAALGMRENIDFGSTGDIKYFIQAPGYGHGVSLDRAYSILMSEKDIRAVRLKRFGDPAPVTKVFSVTEAHSVDHQ